LQKPLIVELVAEITYSRTCCRNHL